MTSDGVRGGSPPAFSSHAVVHQVGYGPRTLCLDDHGGTATIYVGCKDGSVRAVDTASDNIEVVIPPPDGEEPRPRGVRAIVAAPGHLLVGRGDGTIDVFTPVSLEGQRRRWTLQARVRPEDGERAREGEESELAEESVLAMGMLGRDRIWIGFRRRGTFVVPWPVDPRDLEAYLRRKKGEPLCRRSSHGEDAADASPQWLNRIRRLATLCSTSGARVNVLVSEVGELWSWREEDGAQVEDQTTLWPEGEAPTFVHDVALKRARDDEPATGLFIATAGGVYLLTVAADAGLELERLSLPALGSVCMALAYTENAKERLLWAADINGDSHLFWEAAAPEETEEGPPARLNFRPVNLTPSGSQVLWMSAWTSSQPDPQEPRRGDDLVCVQASRNDSIAVVRYRVAGQDEARYRSPKEEKLGRTRRLLDGAPLSDDWVDVMRTKVAELSASVIDEETKPSRMEMPPVAVLADFWEALTEDPDHRAVLRQFLANPSARVAAEMLKDMLPREARAAVRYLTLTLLGIVNRQASLSEEPYLREEALRTELVGTVDVSPSWHGEPRGQAWRPHECSLGILSWLKDLAERVDEGSSLRDEARECVHLVRTWGLFGAANAWRTDLGRPLRVLTADDRPSQLRDRLIYQILRITRGVDEEWSLDSRETGNLYGRSALAISALFGQGPRAKQPELVAVSWNWGGIDLFDVIPEPTANGRDGAVQAPRRGFALSPRKKTLVSDRPREKAAWDPQAGRRVDTAAQDGGMQALYRPTWIDRGQTPLRSAHGNSRAVLLTRIDGCTYVLCSPSQPEPHEDQEMLWAWRLEADGYTQLDPWPLEGTTLHCLIELEPGWYLGGGAHDAKARVVLFRLDVARGGLQQVQPIPLGAREPGSNTVRSLAAHRGRRDDGGWDVFAGCEDGRIWQLPLKASEDLPREEIRALEVARLRAAVVALTCRRGVYVSGSRPVERLFAGGLDGSILAFEGRDEGVLEGPLDKPGFYTLWSTAESSPITAIHLLENPSASGNPGTEAVSSADNDPAAARRPSKGSDSPLQVVIMAEEGFATVIDDRRAGPNMQETKSPRRTPFPGCRHGRYSLGAASSRSLLLHQDLDDEPFCRLLSADDRGRLHGFGLLYQHFSESRRQAYAAAVRLWWQLVSEPGVTGPWAYANLRLADAALGSTHSLPSLLVRWLLDPRPAGAVLSPLPPSPGPAVDEVKRWSLPRYLQHLQDLRIAWDRRPDAPGSRQGAIDTVRRSLKQALRAAAKLQDMQLFREISQGVLRRANLWTAIWAEPGGEAGAPYDFMPDLYPVLLETIDAEVAAWPGSNAERIARTEIGQHVADGHTFFAVITRWSRAVREGEAIQTDLRKILERRVEAVSRLLLRRDTVVNLVSLRTANLSLMRMCFRLGQERRERYDPEAEYEIRWDQLQRYFNDVLRAAMGSLRGAIEPGDPIAHQYARTFALMIYACPRAALRIGNRLTESGLARELGNPSNFARQVSDQIVAIARLGLSTEPFARDLFAAATTPWMPPAFDDPATVAMRALETYLRFLQQDSESPTPENAQLAPATTVIEQVFANYTRDVTGVESVRAAIGRENCDDLAALMAVRAVVDLFKELGRGFAGNAGSVDLAKTHDEAQKMLARPRGTEDYDPYRHSAAFWQNALERWDRELTQDEAGQVTPLPELSRDVLRPELVGFSGKLATWADHLLEDLKQRFEQRDVAGARDEIFEPEYSWFTDVLSTLKDTADAFPRSAEVQRAVVAGVLGHHLLEDLDEHVLDLEEIALALNPRLAHEGRDTEAGTVAQQFARYLLKRAENAQSHPKNLRTLLAILSTKTQDAAAHQLLDPDDVLRGVLEATRHEIDPLGWSVCPLGNEEQLVHLGLVVHELVDNHDKYRGDRARVRRASWDNGRLKLTYDFDQKTPEGEPWWLHRERLEKVWLSHLQRPTDPGERRDPPSSGTGLYLANLAASVVGWRLHLHEKFGNDPPATGTVTFWLEGLPKP